MGSAFDYLECKDTLFSHNSLAIIPFNDFLLRNLIGIKIFIIFASVKTRLKMIGNCFENQENERNPK
jgi:hypothetical protein